MTELAKEDKNQGFLSYFRLKRWINPDDGYSQEIFFVLSLLVTLFLLLALVSFSPQDPSLYNFSFPPRRPHNLCGLFGSHIAGFLIFQFGVLAYILPFPLLWMAWQNMRGHERAFSKGRCFGFLLAAISLAVAAQQWAPALSFQGFSYLASGAMGFWIHKFVTRVVGIGGFYILVFGGAVLALLLIRRQSVIKPMMNRLREWRKDRLESKAAEKSEKVLETGKEKGKGVKDKIIASPAPELPTLSASESPTLADLNGLSFGASEGKGATAQDRDIMNKVILPEPVAKIEPMSLALLDEMEEEMNDPAYVPPPVNIFKSGPATAAIDEEQKAEFESTAEALVKAFSEFGIGGEVIAIQPGPVVTVYEFQPDAGTKLAKVTGLLDDIALALKVDSIFIHPVTGKRALGVQVPNKKRITVFLGDLVQTAAFQNVASPLNFALGKGLNGDPICCDLASMPHLLTAGQTGSGKSVAINSLLCSLILKATPDQVKMILVDPKILELKVYEGIPHLLMPVITEPLKASLALKWACHEMDRRYQLMESAMVRNISGFNQWWEQASADQKQAIRDRFGEQVQGKLPFMVIVIDELADLMLTASKDVENSIQRLAQKARASGIHLVLATQRPSVDVITGVIKANLPSRIAFKVFSRTDSRTILDSMGAERLLGKGDMLFLRPGSTKLERVQGTFLSDEEVVALVDQVKKTSAPHYDATAMEWIDEEYEKQSGGPADFGEDSPGGSDPKWNEAMAIAQRQGAISASYLQRMLKIGYNRAARIVEAMEAQGLVAKADGSKPRAWIGPQV